MTRAGIVLGIWVLYAQTQVFAQEDKDLSRIPLTAQNVTVNPTASPVQEKLYLENDFVLSAARNDLLLIYPGAPVSDIADRLALDAFYQWSLMANLSASFSDRLSLTDAKHSSFPSKAALNDLREAYVTWEVLDQTYLEVGRVNVRNGIALGFNPTDFFKTRTAVNQISLDPSAESQDRLGTFMLRGQRIWDGGSLTVIYAPKLDGPSPLYAGSGFNPDFDHTNSTDRFEASIGFDLADLKPQMFFYSESGHTKYGVSASKPIDGNIVTYVEWAGGRGPDQFSDAISYGIETGSLSNAVLPTLQIDPSYRFQNDLAVGASWASDTKITINLEYHFNQAGFSTSDWRNWFDIGEASPALSPVLWYVRDYASAQQQPISQQQVFLRLDAADAIITDLDLGGFALMNPHDGSALSQLHASYFLSDQWTVGTYLSLSLGGRRTEWGSTPNSTSVGLQVVRYL